jgi:hypothetical protein
LIVIDSIVRPPEPPVPIILKEPEALGVTKPPMSLGVLLGLTPLTLPAIILFLARKEVLKVKIAPPAEPSPSLSERLLITVTL